MIALAFIVKWRDALRGWQVGRDEHRYGNAKLRHLALYISQRHGPIEPSKLANLLGLIDFEAYRRLGKSVTGATYEARPSGLWPRGLERVIADWRPV